ncbi:MAG: FHA domain-containing protein [Anaerolineae bacterium]|nr:FHA domain-containing protein [Anaerolineae bacterium]
MSAPTMPYLESIGYQGQRQRFPLDKSVIRIGRAEDNDIVITDRFQGWDTVSRVHATIERDGARYVIVDQGSLNGVYVNGRRTGRNLLRDGWKVAIGAVEFIYHQPPTPSQPD